MNAKRPVDGPGYKMRLAGWVQDPEQSEEALSRWIEEPGGHGTAYWLAKTCGNRLLIVNPQPLPENEKEHATTAVLRNEGGVWQTSMAAFTAAVDEADKQWQDWLFGEHRRKMEADPNAYRSHNRWLQQRLGYTHNTATARYEQAMACLPRVVKAMTIIGQDPGVTECWRNELDADLRYLGFDDAVYDLQEHRKLHFAEAKAALVSRSVGVRFSDLPNEKDIHPDAELILNHPYLKDDPQKRDLLRYLRQSLAHAIGGQPAQRLNLLIDEDASDQAGDGGAGKTTILQAVAYSMGETGLQLELDALRGKREGASGRATPEMAPLVLCRMVWTDELNGIVVNPDRYKMVTGSAPVKFRFLYGQHQERPVIASIFGTSNARIRLNLDGGAELRRYCPIPIPRIPEAERIPGLADRFRPDRRGSIRRRASILAILLDELRRLDGKEPVIPQTVLDLAKEQQKDSMGTPGEWAQNHVRSSQVDNDRIASKTLWQAYTHMTPEREKWVAQKHLSQAVRAVHGMKSKDLKIDGKAVKGFTNIRLSDEAWQALAQQNIGHQQSMEDTNG